ncbi:13155_t:CDS:2, partial [Racocetra persica]
SDLDLTVEENFNLKTGITKEFSDLDIDEYSDAWFNEDSNLNTSDTNEDLEEVAFFTKKLCANQIIHKYPTTSEDSVVMIFNVDGWDNYMDAFNNVQYSINGSGGTTIIQNCPFFGNISVKKDKQRCQGIKYCEFSDPTYLNIVHKSVDVESDFYRKITAD